MTTTDELLAERGKTHGDYAVHAKITQMLKDFYRAWPNWQKLTPDQRETMDMEAHKNGRILAGNPEFADHWDDKAGYNKLSADQIRARATTPETPPNS